MLAAGEGVVVGDLETESKNVVHSQPRALPDVVCIVLQDELRHALDSIFQISHVREDELARVKVLRLHVHYLHRWVGIRQLHRDPEGEATELDKACSQMFSDDLLHRLDEFEQVALRGSAREKHIVLDHSTHCDIGTHDLECNGLVCVLWRGTNDDGLGWRLDWGRLGS